MPFDATPVIERPRRLLALDPSLLAFGAMPQNPDAAGFRPLPAWHSARDPEHVGATIGVLARARELIADDRCGCRCGLEPQPAPVCLSPAPDAGDFTYRTLEASGRQG